MFFELTNNKLDVISATNVIVFVFEGEKSFEPTSKFEELDIKFDGGLTKILKIEEFKGKIKTSLKIYTYGKIPSPKITIVGLGKKESISKEKLLKTFAQIAKQSIDTTSVATALLEEKECNIPTFKQLKALSLGLLLGSYKFGKYQTKKDDEKELETCIVSVPQKLVSDAESKQVIEEMQNLFMAIRLARDLVNEQSAVATPRHLGELAKDIAKKDENIKCTVYEKKEIEKMGMEAFLGIARGGNDPRFISLEYSPPNYSGKETIALIGKGITFDTGGVSLKPSQYMTTMKLDMAGGAAILAIFSIISRIKPNVKVIGLVAATPNVVSGESIVPGDIVRAMNGKTIEIVNTDAEGRVTLADSISYAVKKGATKIVDLATLTGACEVALGTDYAALYSNNEKLKQQLLDAANSSGEKVWEMPLVEEYKDLNKSEVADLSNLASIQWGGSITAALFLQEFVGDLPWVHFDIAGPAFLEKDTDLGPKGGTGFGVAMLYEFLKKNYIK